MKIRAYFEEWSRRPGQRVRMAISTGLPTLHASLERLVTGPGLPGESRVGSEPVPGVLDITIPGRRQRSPVGSCARLPLPAGLPKDAVTIHCGIWPTLPEKEAQTIWSMKHGGAALRLVVENGRLSLRNSEAAAPLAVSALPIAARKWYSVAASIGPRGSVIDVCFRSDGYAPRANSRDEGGGAALGEAHELLLAATGIDSERRTVESFNGKIDSPRIFAGTLSAGQCQTLHRGEALPVPPVAGWALDRDWGSLKLASRIAGAPAGDLINGVERGVTGINWDGSSDSFNETPQHYCALQFHEDDMVDADWDYDLDFMLPDKLRSGIYAVKLTCGEAVDRYPLFVLGARSESAPVLFLAPTNTYLAYGNDHLAALDFSAVMTHEMVVPEDEKLLFSDREFGRSCYDTHCDGTPVRYSSRRRPVINIRPGYPNWLTGSYQHFAADMHIVEWLEKSAGGYHVATDEDLHLEGLELLKKYKVIVTGSHPEYWTRHGRAILNAYLKAGGRLMYLGGNGFYWVTSHDAERPWIIEVRRDNTGTRCWDAPHGERTHAATAEQGGIWKNRGRGPHALVGVGFSAEGWSKGSGYRRQKASYEGPGAVFFRGVNEELVGDFGHMLGGAAGDEVDRHDVALGSPAHAHVLATSTPLGNEYQLVIEEQTLALPDQGGQHKPGQVRADMVYFTTGNDGAVFSIGSITYAGALAFNEFDNNISRITSNVLNAFMTNLPPE